MTASNETSRDKALKVLTALANMYPHSNLARKLDSDDERTYQGLVAVWSRGVEKLSPERIKRGFDQLLGSGSKFEPSLPEFIELCSTPREHRTYAALPDNTGAPLGHEPASIRHYPEKVQRQLKRMDVAPKPGETHHEYCERCKEFCMSSYGGKLRQVGIGESA